ncbi:MAG: type II toxin-antitoxin system RelE/ParE family toxin [Limisphaerales bacterium]
MKTEFLDEARQEFLQALSFLESQQAGLGQRFKDEVDRNVLWIASHPDVLRVRPGGYRRMNLRIFPYYIAYLIRGDTIWVLAVAHGHRKPDYWVRRKTQVP